MTSACSSTTATAPGKIILFGEHAVVYGRPAIAVPVTDVQATATIERAATGSGCILTATDIGAQIRLADATDHLSDPLALCMYLALEAAGITTEPDWHISVRSTIPMAGGMGSGAAVSTALARAILAHAGHVPQPQMVSHIVFAVEKLHHGTPSGIDNTVIAYERPVWFVRGRPPQVFRLARSFQLLIADTGIASPTRQTVADVRRAWQEEPNRYETVFDGIAAVVKAARQALASGDVAALGPLMQENQCLLRQLDVSSERLERLIAIAEEAGAAGAKLSGGGRGGNLIALVDAERTDPLKDALLAGGATRVIVTPVVRFR